MRRSQGSVHRRTPAVSRLAAAVCATALLGVAGCHSGGDGDAGGGVGGGAARAQPSPAGPVWDRAPDSVAAVGDSITRGFDACSVLSDCPKVSWATGTDKKVDSLALRLLGPDKVGRRSWNHAVTGARMADLPKQMTRAAAHRPDLVTVLAGANDACRSTVDAMTPVDGFRASFRKALDALHKASPRSEVFVASIPDLKRLWSQGRGNPLGTQIWKLGICPSMLGGAASSDKKAEERRRKVDARVRAYNEVLTDECEKDRLCRSDGGAVFKYRFGAKQLSHWDWFHPSVDGQARIARIAYGAVTAAGS